MICQQSVLTLSLCLSIVQIYQPLIIDVLLLQIAETAGEFIQKISRKAKKEDVLVDKNPVSEATNTTFVKLTYFNDIYMVLVPGGTVFSAKSLPDAMLLALKIFYLGNMNYPKSVKCIYGILEGLAGIPITINLGAVAKRVISEVKARN